MSIQIRPIKNPHTDGRGQAMLVNPSSTDKITVRYDEYDYAPAFFVSMWDDPIHILDFAQLDDGVTFRLSTTSGEVTLVLGMPAHEFIRKIEEAIDEWSRS